MAMAVLTLNAVAANSQDSNSPGIVRISDSKPRSVVQPTSFHGHLRGHAVQGDGYICDHCQQSQCDEGCPLFREHYCKNSPDHGYAPPAKYPLHRRGVPYNTWYPNQWYGLPGSGLAGGYPMVYQPTDTTQLGYYYQHVPFWTPNPNMLPQRPVPAQWHIGAPAVYGSDYHRLNGQSGYNSGYSNCQYPVSDGVIHSPTPAAPPAQGAPVPAATVPPSPREIQSAAESDHIRRASF